MTYQRVQYKGRTKNISISVIDNQEFVLLQDVHDIFPKITVLLSADDNPIQYEMDDKGNRLLPLRIKAYSNDTLIGYSPDDSDTSDNSQKTTGYVVSATGISIDPAKTKITDEWPALTNVDELRSFLGLCSYYRRFMVNFSSLAEPLTRLLKANVDVKWEPE
ncbi:unnamed protein product [Didymodactylos carnosus]|uniref:Uncharacterized protein n=1 Tax=Didymodactylos carnosus TaxID=1234261 RepID=A0A815AY45_9BILA|nr:unnamed protein product [Didymodactylos carnosus]CAF4040069.1 unnamed protein product [Didymodactylos carnosus]